MINFKIIDATNPSRPVRGKWYIDQEGKLYSDCDPSGVDMSGKRRIARASENYTYIEVDNNYSSPGVLGL